jgi:hypothetical protein
LNVARASVGAVGAYTRVFGCLPARSHPDGLNDDGAGLRYRKQGRLVAVPVVKGLEEKTTWSPCRLSCRRLGPSCHGAGSFPGTS